MTDAIIIAAVRVVLPWVTPEHVEVRRASVGRPCAVVCGDASWLARMGQPHHEGVGIVRYDLGVAVLVVHIDGRTRGTA